MKDVLLKLNVLELDYLKNILVVNEEKLLTRLENRVDVEDNNLHRINLNREIQNKIYLLLDELDEKAEKKGKKKLGLNGQKEEEKELLNTDDVIEVFTDHGVSLDDLIEEYAARDYETLEEFVEVIVGGLEKILEDPLDKEKIVADLVEMIEESLEKSKVENKEEEDNNSVEEETSKLVNFMELMIKGRAGGDLNGIIMQSELDEYLQHESNMEEIIKYVIEEIEEDSGLKYNFNENEFNVVVETAKQLAEEGSLEEFTIKEGDIVYLSKNNDEDTEEGLYEICVVKQIEEQKALLNLIKNPEIAVYADLEELTLLRG